MMSSNKPQDSGRGTFNVNEKLLNKIIDAWESLGEGYFSPKAIEHWLIEKMSPVINEARKHLGRKLTHKCQGIEDYNDTFSER